MYEKGYLPDGWKNESIQHIYPYIKLFLYKDILQMVHTTVRTTLGFANMHLSVLRQAQNNSVKRAMFEDITINLVSSLEATAHVVTHIVVNKLIINYNSNSEKK